MAKRENLFSHLCNLNYPSRNVMHATYPSGISFVLLFFCLIFFCISTDTLEPKKSVPRYRNVAHLTLHRVEPCFFRKLYNAANLSQNFYTSKQLSHFLLSNITATPAALVLFKIFFQFRYAGKNLGRQMMILVNHAAGEEFNCNIIVEGFAIAHRYTGIKFV